MRLNSPGGVPLCLERPERPLSPFDVPRKKLNKLNCRPACCYEDIGRGGSSSRMEVHLVRFPGIKWDGLLLAGYGSH